ncbi:hypothetical protein [Pleionea sp. CnH1-48]|uniref:hypothetical protein n=1 Tax=Pleionea sp. CnH1-48 TaxID=2954494 RepID=UPI0020985816|nr:hypothetical protein [Pleionea sp. CnH1-48]MCO7225784.1 hypothetical protein [Pleionea sp. CnH1-48]
MKLQAKRWVAIENAGDDESISNTKIRSSTPSTTPTTTIKLIVAKPNLYNIEKIIVIHHQSMTDKLLQSPWLLLQKQGGYLQGTHQLLNISPILTSMKTDL